MAVFFFKNKTDFVLFGFCVLFLIFGILRFQLAEFNFSIGGGSGLFWEKIFGGPADSKRFNLNNQRHPDFLRAVRF